MKIVGKNTAVGTSAEDIITAGATLTAPTQERIHAIVSDSTADDSDGTPQVETATIAGTVDGILQVETATVAGSIGGSGAGDIDVTVTGALISGSPLALQVAVANSDTAAQVAGKIRTALNATSAITTNYTVGGSSATVTLTTKVKAANDTTLNIAYANGTASGLTNAATSANTTAGHAGTGNAAVVVTGALVTGSPHTYNVPVVTADNASAIASKIRIYLGAQASITDNYVVSGATDKVILTAKAGAANDSSLNIAVADGTSNGVTTAASSANTTAGIAATGAQKVKISGINAAGTPINEIVTLNGTSAVNTTKAYAFIHLMEVTKAGTGGANAGTILATAATDSTVSCKIEAGKGVSQYATYSSNTGTISNLKVSTSNSTADAITYVDVLVKKADGAWAPVLTIQLDDQNPKYENAETLYVFSGKALVKIQATSSAGSSSVVASFDAN